jgi:hypothetical protein
MAVWWMICLAFTSVMATIQTRIALGKNDEDYGLPFITSENLSLAAAILSWLFPLGCLVAFIATL